MKTLAKHFGLTVGP